MVVIPPSRAAGETGVLRAYVCVTLLVGGVVSWRPYTYFTGTFDPVVALKALLVGVALLVAFTIPRRIEWDRLPVSVLVLLVVYSLETTLGGWSNDSFVPAAVLSIRLLLTASVLILLVAKFRPMDVFVILRNAMLAFAAISVATGSSGSGRLFGGTPPLFPNELALLFGVSALSLAAASLAGRGSLLRPIGIVVLLAMVYLTGSRTGLAVLVIALVVMLLLSRRVPVPAFIAAVSVVPIAFFVIGTTGVLATFVDRGGAGNVTTLSSRTIAWDAALHRGGTIYEQVFGGGLQLKQIPVQGQYWNVQTLDSTWVSALVQGGYLGIVLLGVWSFIALARAIRCPGPQRVLWTGLLVFVIGRSVLESGMFDSTPAFLVFFLACFIDRRPAPVRTSDVAAPVRTSELVRPLVRTGRSSAG